MDDIKFAIGKGKTFYDYSELVTSVTISGRKGAAPRNISVTLFDSEGYAMQRALVDVENGQTCVLYVDKKEVFRGLLMTEIKNSSRKLTVKAWDNCIYLCNSKDSFSYKNKRADQILKDCCKRAGLKVGTIVNTGKVIPELVKPNTTYWDVIQEALSETYYRTGRRYYISSVKGKIYLKQRLKQNSKDIPYLDLTTNTETYEQTRSIYDTRTRIKLITSKNKTKKSYINKNLEKKIGKFQDIQSVDNDATATELNQKISTFKTEKSIVTQSLSWAGVGNISIVAGGCVYVKINPLGLKQVMYVDEDTHTFQDGKHQMKLKLNYVPDFNSEKTTTSSKTASYRVNAKSGLNLRKAPNSTIITTMPHNAVVDSDGKSSGNWLHVKYKDKWGYAYNRYLSKK